jgi:hypothetical protein
LLANIARLRDVDVTMSSYCICRIENIEILKSNVSLWCRSEIVAKSSNK